MHQKTCHRDKHRKREKKKETARECRVVKGKRKRIPRDRWIEPIDSLCIRRRRPFFSCSLFILTKKRKKKKKKKVERSLISGDSLEKNFSSSCLLTIFLLFLFDPALCARTTKPSIVYIGSGGLFPKHLHMGTTHEGRDLREGKKKEEKQQQQRPLFFFCPISPISFTSFNETFLLLSLFF